MLFFSRSAMCIPYENGKTLSILMLSQRSTWIRMWCVRGRVAEFIKIVQKLFDILLLSFDFWLSSSVHRCFVRVVVKNVVDWCSCIGWLAGWKRPIQWDSIKMRHVWTSTTHNIRMRASVRACSCVGAQICALLSCSSRVDGMCVNIK